MFSVIRRVFWGGVYAEDSLSLTWRIVRDGLSIFTEVNDRGRFNRLYELMTVVLGEATSFDGFIYESPSITLTSSLF
jgi:hypothetical protein